MPEQRKTSFDAFWHDCPHKIGKEPARKAWQKLSAGNQEAAHKAVKRFYEWFSKTYPTASPLHPSTYLNNKRWLDLEPEKSDNNQQVIEMHRAALNSKIPAVSEASRRALIQMGADV